MLQEFLVPLPQAFTNADQFAKHTLGGNMRTYGLQFPTLNGVQVALFGVADDRLASGNECGTDGANAVRECLYGLFAPHNTPIVADIGNIAPGHTPQDTLFALQAVCGELMGMNIMPIILGGSHALTYAQFAAYEQQEQMVDLLAIDSSIDLATPEGDLPTPSDHLHRIVVHEPYLLFNMAVIGYQTYLTNPEDVDAFEKLFFDAHRLGEMRANLQEMEPVIRQADMVSFDLTAIRMSEAPGNAFAGPNGLMAHEACQLMRYAGMSDKLSSVGFYNLNPLLDVRNATAQLVAQLVWFVLDGIAQRVGDLPSPGNSNFTRYIASIKEGEHEVVFYKSRKSGRWWMEVPGPSRPESPERKHIVPCNFADYQTACNEELPDKWWRAHQKYV